MKDQILKLHRDFDRAELSADLDTLRRLLTDDFQSIGPRGFVLDKNAWIGRHAQFKYHSLDSSEVDVREYGDAAIVRNVQRNRASYQGQEMDHAVRVSQVWVQQAGEWKLAGIQFSPLAQP
jgi:ketosteroid isomerase-like protein